MHDDGSSVPREAVDQELETVPFWERLAQNARRHLGSTPDDPFPMVDAFRAAFRETAEELERQTRLVDELRQLVAQQQALGSQLGFSGEEWAARLWANADRVQLTDAEKLHIGLVRPSVVVPIETSSENPPHSPKGRPPVAKSQPQLDDRLARAAKAMALKEAAPNRSWADIGADPSVNMSDRTLVKYRRALEQRSEINSDWN